jgi:hypothetical protein
MEGYCRMLGHYIPFDYCRTQQNGNPCSKILDCYHERIPIREFIESHYSEKEREGLFKESAPKISSLIELIEKAKARSAAS